MAHTLRQSSVNLYETHWQRFVQWCRGKNLNVFDVRSTQFSNYMMSLFDAQMTPSTIISHRTSIASVLRHWRYDPATDPQIRLLLRGFRMARPRQRVSMPKWDLHLVLRSLLMPPYVSDTDFSTDHAIDLKWRTIKTVFLFSLASARRVSFLHALSCAPGHLLFGLGNAQNQQAVSVLPEPGFLTKTQLPSEAPSWITVPGIAYLNPREPERLLCPVRQLRLYLRDSATVRRDRTRLFVHWDPSIRDITKAHIARWIVEVVKHAYVENDLNLPEQVNAHELRALAASWAYNAHVALEDVLAACSWSSPGVFQNNYLRDMSLVSEGMYSLGPVVVAQHVTGSC